MAGRIRMILLLGGFTLFLYLMSLLANRVVG